MFSSPVVMGMKVFISWACELATAAQLDLDLREKDKVFSFLFQTYLLHILEEFDPIRPFQYCLVEVGSNALAFVRSRDGSVSGFLMKGHLITGDKDGNVQSKIVTAKNKIGKCTVVIHKLLSLVLSAAHSCAVLRL